MVIHIGLMSARPPLIKLATWRFLMVSWPRPRTSPNSAQLSPAAVTGCQLSTATSHM